jgi:hypothetical protein
MLGNGQYMTSQGNRPGQFYVSEAVLTFSAPFLIEDSIQKTIVKRPIGDQWDTPLKSVSTSTGSFLLPSNVGDPWLLNLIFPIPSGLVADRKSTLA